MPTVAEHRLKELCSGILQNQSSPKTLAHFRLSNLAIMQDLEDFAASPNGEDDRSRETNPLLDQVLGLFQRLNLHMAEQERSCPTWGDFFVASRPKGQKPSSSVNTNRLSLKIPSKTEISVVFGGKFSKNPASISEQLVSNLVLRSQTVYTVSRSTCHKDGLPSNVKHIPKQNLDVTDDASNGGISTGADEFYDVMYMAKEEWLMTSSSQQPTVHPTTTTLVFYFTLGQHKGVNPFIRNLNSAQNFHRALRKLSSSCPEITNTSNVTRRNWRIVVTGTDATLPSTHPPSEMTIPVKGNDHGDTIMLTVPTYKIGANNFVYAMSKLGQHYWIANAVAGLLMVQNCEKGKDQYEDIVHVTEGIFKKIKHHVTDAGEDGAYHGGSSIARISMEELDTISLQMSSLMGGSLLRDHFQIAEQISICYTPLHAKPWTKDAIQSTTSKDASISTLPSMSTTLISSQKAFILEQIVKRFKNAISIESAASSHFPQS